MEFYSKIYNCYYTVVRKILNKSLKDPLCKKDITEIINKDAFSESAFYILPKLIDGEWKLLDKVEEKYKSKLTSTIKRPATSLEKAWLKSILSDKRTALFLSEDTILQLEESLKDMEPLFKQKDFYYYDTFLDGDNYESVEYIKNFRRILTAVKAKKTINITYESGKGEPIKGNFIPMRIEYSNKDDKFRLQAFRVGYNRKSAAVIINIARITEIQDCLEEAVDDINFYKYIEQNKCDEPVIIEISKERNAVERCMLHFASYEKSTEYDVEKDRYISHIYYDKRDEAELLIRILSFGPVIRVLGPENFLKQVRDRVKSQCELLYKIKYN